MWKRPPLALAFLLASAASAATAQTDTVSAPRDSVRVEQPVLVRAPRPRYPNELRDYAVEGEVLVEVMVDTTGRPVPRSIRIVRSTDRRFEPSARAVALGARFRPGRFSGQPARLPVIMLVTFTVQWEDYLPFGCPHVPSPDTAPSVAESSLVGNERPERLWSPRVNYPEGQAGIKGHVLVEVVINEQGCVEPRSLRVLAASAPAFGPVSIAAVVGSRYRPGRVGGHPVRVRVQVPVNFSINRRW